jgi:hypothetical protein
MAQECTWCDKESVADCAICGDPHCETCIFTCSICNKKVCVIHHYKPKGVPVCINCDPGMRMRDA